MNQRTSKRRATPAQKAILADMNRAALALAAEAERRLGKPTCRVCGCTDDRACEGGCTWVEPDLCSACCVDKPDRYGEVDLERFYAAFVAWENGVRVAPQAYRSIEECAALALDQVSSERADYFLALLNGQGEPA